jgi:hypothetical protein
MMTSWTTSSISPTHLFWYRIYCPGVSLETGSGTFVEVEGAADVYAVDVTQDLTCEGVFDGKEHFCAGDDAGHHIFCASLDYVAQMNTSIDNIQVVFMHQLWRRIVQKAYKDMSSG